MYTLFRQKKISKWRLSFAETSCCDYLQPSSLTGTLWNYTKRLMKISFLLKALEFSGGDVQGSSLENVFSNSQERATVLPLANMHYLGSFLETLAPLFFLFSGSVILRDQ